MNMSESVKKPSKTAALIQEVATDMFANYGYDGTIMDELAVKTGANKASIYYHFGNKKGLYEACMTSLFSGVANQVLAAITQQNAPLDKLSAFIRAFSKAAYACPNMPAVLMREMASSGENMPVSARQQMQRLLFGLKDILEEGVRKRVLIPIQPLTVQMMIVGSLSLYITSEPLRNKIQSAEKVDISVSEMTEEVVMMVQNGLKVT
ncbi:MAG: TetR/AcrR family transcriptional regulator [Thiomicrorhabdus sp.]|nr:TetR/AcrR family transcriptional regulator [Thiomicrorhabdus sp.]